MWHRLILVMAVCFQLTCSDGPIVTFSSCGSDLVARSPCSCSLPQYGMAGFNVSGTCGDGDGCVSQLTTLKCTWPDQFQASQGGYATKNISWNSVSGMKCSPGYFLQTLIPSAAGERTSTAFATAVCKSPVPIGIGVVEAWRGTESKRWNMNGPTMCSANYAVVGFELGTNVGISGDLSDISFLICALPVLSKCQEPGSPGLDVLRTYSSNNCVSGFSELCSFTDVCRSGFASQNATPSRNVTCGVAREGLKTDPNPIGSWNCYNINECNRSCTYANETGCHTCSSNATCTDTSPSYTCKCNPGFGGNGFACAQLSYCNRLCTSDITTECHNCPTNLTNGTDRYDSLCTEQIGGFTCECPAGFIGTGGNASFMRSNTCRQRNECQDGTDTCPRDATQNNSRIAGSMCTDAVPDVSRPTNFFSCGCAQGFENAPNCTDVNECLKQCEYDAEKNNPFQFKCHNCNLSLSTCVNIVGGAAQCNCSAGYTFNLISGVCDEINECVTQPCGSNVTGVCIDLVNKRECMPIINSAMLLGLTNRSAPFNLTSTSQSSADRVLLNISQPTSGISWDGSIYYGSLSQSRAIQADCVKLASTLYLCSMAAGGGSNLMFSIRGCLGDSCSVVSHPSFRFSYPSPTLTSGSLCSSGSCGPFINVSYSSVVTMNGTNFVNLKQFMRVTFAASGKSYDCDIQTVSFTSLSCIPSDAYSNFNYRFSVSVGLDTANQTVVGSDKFNFTIIEGASISSITPVNTSNAEDCQVGPNGTLMNCPCIGGTQIIVTGDRNLTEPVSLMVDGNPATNVSVSGRTLRCILPPGVGDARPVYLITGAKAGPVSNLISYQGPIITNISFSNNLCIQGSSGTNPTLNNCERTNNGGLIFLSGRNFGSSGAIILTNSMTIEATHLSAPNGNGPYENNGADRYLQFNLPNGSGRQTIVVFQRNGKGSTNLVSYNYKDCPEGTFASRNDCVPCLVGQYSNAGATKCLDCPRGFQQPSQGQGACVPCGPGKFAAATGMPNCTPCDPGSSASTSQAISCDKCITGTYAAGSNATKCEDCPPGKVAGVGMSGCSDCTAGKKSSAARAQCQDCDAGTFAVQAGSSCSSCDPGKAQNKTGQSACDDCEPGKYTNDLSMYNCRSCPGGKYTKMSGQSLCQECEVGRFRNESMGAGAGCANCSIGTVASSNGLTACTVCNTGRFMNKTGNQFCEDCVPGSYLPPSNDPATMCLRCEPGKFSGVPASTGCLNCTVGFHQPSGNASACDPCLPGKISRFSVAIACEDCFQGYAQPLSGQSVCVVCDPGRFAVESATSTCQRCQPGYYSDFQATGCMPCPAGFYQSGFEKGSCDPCPPGQFNNYQNATKCESCAAGFFSKGNASRSCESCDPGNYSSLGSTICNLCAAGTYASNKGQPECKHCPNGAHEDDRRTACLCPIRSYSVVISTVENGRNLTSYLCRECPSGFVCQDEGLTAEALVEGSGYWRPTNSVAVTYRCVNPSLCLGSGQCKPHRVGPMCAVCEEGYKASGPAGDCGLCSPDNGQTWGYTVGIILLIIFLLCIFYYAVLKVSSSQQIKLQKLANMKDEQSIQALEELQKEFAVDDAYFEAERAQYAAKNNTTETESEETNDTSETETSEEDYRVTKAANDRALIAAQNPASYSNPIFVTPSQGRSSMAQVVRPGEKDLPDEFVNEKGTFRLRHLSMASRRAPNFMYKVKILVGFFQISSILPLQGEIAWPTAFTDFISVFAILNFDFIPWQSLSCATKINYYGRSMLVGCIPIVVVIALVLFFYVPMYLRDLDSITDQLRKQHKRNNRNRQFIRLLLFTVFLLYPFVSKIVLGIYNCVTVEDTTYLVADFELHCSDPEWRMYAGICAIFVLMYPIGIPVICYFILRRSYTQLHEPAVILQFGFLYEAYNDQRWYWELIDLVHKLILTSIVVFAPSSWILGVNMFVIGVYLILILVCHPYVRKGDDRFHLLTQTELFLLAFVGYIIQRENIVFLDDPVLDSLLSACLIVIVLFLVMSFIIIAGRNVHKIWLHAKVKKFAKESKAVDTALVQPQHTQHEPEKERLAALEL